MLRISYKQIFVAAQSSTRPVEASADQTPGTAIRQHAERLVVQQPAAGMVGPSQVTSGRVPNVGLIVLVPYAKIRQIHRGQAPRLLSACVVALTPVSQQAYGQRRMMQR